MKIKEVDEEKVKIDKERVKRKKHNVKDVAS